MLLNNLARCDCTMVEFTDDEIDGMQAYSEAIRREVSGTSSPIGPNQRAELMRLCAEAFEVRERIPRLWFTMAKSRRAMLRIDVPPDDLIARIVLAKCLVGGVQEQAPRRNWERVAAPGQSEGLSYPLRDCLYGPYVGEIFHWEFNGYAFNIFRGTSDAERKSFFLQWDYEYYVIPSWVPKRLRPYEGIDPNPY